MYLEEWLILGKNLLVIIIINNTKNATTTTTKLTWDAEKTEYVKVYKDPNRKCI